MTVGSIIPPLAVKRQLGRPSHALIEDQAMNVANLQIEGLIMAVAAINQTLVARGVLSVEDIELALRKAESSMTSDERLLEDMSPSNRDAVCFPIRLLRMANLSQSEADVPSFAELARMVGRNKDPYNDQQ